jgi:hypothetical protein
VSLSIDGSAPEEKTQISISATDPTAGQTCDQIAGRNRWPAPGAVEYGVAMADGCEIVYERKYRDSTIARMTVT